MKGITIHQPWAWAIATGEKQVENRGWATHYRGKLAIHAGVNKRWLIEGRLWLEKQGIAVPASLDKGCIIGVCDLVDCLPLAAYRKQYGADFWASGPFCWRLENFRAVRPFVIRGVQGLFPIEFEHQLKYLDARAEAGIH